MTTVLASTGTLYIKQDSGDPIEWSVDGNAWNTPTWPVTIVNTDTGLILRVLFVTDIVINNPNQYFICASNMIQFGDTSLREDGARYTCTVDGVTNYPGLIQNGTDSLAGFSNIYVYNIAVLSTGGSSLRSEYGWVGHGFFGHGRIANRVVNCYSDGDISNLSGGILGGNAAYNSGDMIIIGCYSSGLIDSYAGGILGTFSASTGGTIRVEKCYSTGLINPGGGGIVGDNSANGGTVVVTNCYSLGNIYDTAGGIFGTSPGVSNGTAVAIKCYSRGDIFGNSGGIFGTNAGFNSGIATAENCYSVGSMLGNSGGIFGGDYEIGQATAIHCYSAGSGFGVGGIYKDSSDDNLYGSNNYSETNRGGSGWTAVNANSVLVDVGIVWVEITPGQPYELTAIGYTPYTIQNINVGDGSLIRTYSQTITAGDSSAASYLVGYTFTILSGGALNIDAGSGAITASAAGTYTVVVRHHRDGLYGITSVVLTVNALPGAADQTIVDEADASLGFEFAYDILAGRVFIAERASNPYSKFSSYADYIRYKAALG